MRVYVLGVWASCAEDELLEGDGRNGGSLPPLTALQLVVGVCYVVLQQCIQEKKPLGRPVTSCVERLRGLSMYYLRKTRPLDCALDFA